jgi:hypothetical protein
MIMTGETGVVEDLSASQQELCSMALVNMKKESDCKPFLMWNDFMYLL